MESNGGDASRILREIETLKATKTEIEQRISALEAQLRETNLDDRTGTVLNGSCPPISTVHSDFGHSLSPEMIYRYSRHLLLPSFGVQGQLTSSAMLHV